VVEVPFSASSAFFLLVLEDSGATVDTTELPSTAISASLAAAAEMDVTGLARGSRDVEESPAGELDAELALTLAAEAKSAMPAHT
jgi:hypothetical protein